MGIFQRIRNAFIQFMYGRNGLDKLAVTSVWIGLLLDVIAPFFLYHRHRMLGSVLHWAATLLLLYAVFRIFSKNLNKRREENQRWQAWLWQKKSSRSGAKARHADKEHKYFTCQHCGTICRVPVGKGTVVITCPKCGAQIRGRT